MVTIMVIFVYAPSSSPSPPPDFKVPGAAPRRADQLRRGQNHLGGASMGHRSRGMVTIMVIFYICATGTCFTHASLISGCGNSASPPLPVAYLYHEHPPSSRRRAAALVQRPQNTARLVHEGRQGRNLDEPSGGCDQCGQERDGFIERRAAHFREAEGESRHGGELMGGGRTGVLVDVQGCDSWEKLSTIKRLSRQTTP